MKLAKILQITILTTFLMGVSLGEFYNPVFAGPLEEASEFINKGDLHSAEPFIEKIEDEQLKDILLGNLVAKFIEKGELSSAAPLIEKFTDQQLKDIWTVNLVAKSIEKGEFSSVEDLLEKMGDEELKATMGVGAMMACLEKEDLKKASEFLSYVKDEQVLTNIFFVFITKYKDKNDYLGMLGFVLRFIFSGKISQVNW